jgi:hypothetical protein
VGDQIAVCYPISSYPYWAKATSAALKAADITNSGKSATFTVTLVNPKEGNLDINYCYPAALATIDGGYDENALANQDGTLASISSGLDFCIEAVHGMVPVNCQTALYLIGSPSVSLRLRMLAARTSPTRSLS